MKTINDLAVKIFADGADLVGMLDMNKKPHIKGFTTNPTLMKKAGIKNYKRFALEVLSIIIEKPISFEVFSDDFKEMKRQALEIASWGDNVYVKIPITNTKGESSASLIKYLSEAKVKVNVTAIMTFDQIETVLPFLVNSPAAYVSIFAGRVADTGRDPIPIMKRSVDILKNHKNIELIWASSRELLNVFQADDIGCDIITVTNNILNKIPLIGKDLNEFSLETVKMFYRDAKLAEYKI